MAEIQCPNCRVEFKGAKAYARHILREHKDDPVRVAWAKGTLGQLQIPVDLSEVKYRGHSLDRTPPARVNGLPKHLQGLFVVEG